MAPGEVPPAVPELRPEQQRHGDGVRDPQHGEDGDAGDDVLEGEEHVALQNRHTWLDLQYVGWSKNRSEKS